MPEAETDLTFDQAIDRHLVEMEATKGEKTYRQHPRELRWFRKHGKKRLVSNLDRSDAMVLFAKGRKEMVDNRLSASTPTPRF